MFVINQNIQAIKAGERIIRKVLSHSSKLMLCELTLQKGAVVVEHAHPHEQITYIISGTCCYTVGAETKTVGAGDSVLIPDNMPHSVHVVEDMVVVDVFSPAREDFLPSGYRQ